MNDKQEGGSIADALGDALSVVVPIILVILLVVILPNFQLQTFIHTFTQYEKELSAERHEIEGVVKSVEVVDVKPEPPPPVKEDDKKGRMHVDIQLGGSRKQTKITFEDGRSMDFYGVSAKPVEVGRYYVITYDGRNRIVDFRVTNQNSQGTILEEKANVH
jgi:hypothetical protein